MSYWTGLTYNTNWADYGNSYAPGGFKIDGDRVHLRGVFIYTGGTTYSAGPNLIATLPAGFAPSNLEQYATLNATLTGNTPGVGLVQIRIDSSGNIYLLADAGGEVSAYPVSLDGISFSILS
jgi:hypothetical protein